jgi:hypothetical protein
MVMSQAWSTDRTPADVAVWAGGTSGGRCTARWRPYRDVQDSTRVVGDDDSLAPARRALRSAAETEPLEAERIADADAIVAGALAADQVRGDQVADVEAWLRGRTDAGTRVTGRADLVLTHGNGAIEIRHHKIARAPRSAEELRGDRQPALYAWMAGQQRFEAPAIVVSHHYPPLQRVVSVPVDWAYVDQVVHQLDRWLLRCRILRRGNVRRDQARGGEGDEREHRSSRGGRWWDWQPATRWERATSSPRRSARST